MTKAIKVIRNEHLGLKAIYRTLSGVIHDIAEGREQPNFELFHALIDYLKNFMYQFHHPKENDYLFPAVAKRRAAAAELIAVLEGQHKQGAKLLLQLETTLEQYEKEGESALPEFMQAFEVYHQFEWEHMKLEETEIIPMARRVLTGQDWEKIDRVFLNHSDPLFGDEKRAEFKKLFDHIAKVAPGPYGSGQLD